MNMNRLLMSVYMAFIACTMMNAKTLVVYYSYTHNCQTIVKTLTSQIEADVLEITPAEKGLRYEANNYALGTQLLNAIRANPNTPGSYPAIDPITADLSEYDMFIIVTPLWWSQMAAIMQTFLFHYGSQMAGKYVGLVVSSASSRINGVENDCKRLVPHANYFNQNLWINNSNRSNQSRLIQDWLDAIGYHATAGIDGLATGLVQSKAIFAPNGQRLVTIPDKGVFIMDGKKMVNINR